MLSPLPNTNALDTTATHHPPVVDPVADPGRDGARTVLVLTALGPIAPQWTIGVVSGYLGARREDPLTAVEELALHRQG